jgi:phosphoglycolate phosphatase
MSLRLVVFDMDGTLVDSQHAIVEAMTEAFDVRGHVLPPRDEVLGIVGLSLNEAMAALAPHLPEVETQALAQAYRDGWLARRDAGLPVVDSPLYPGARAALERLEAAGVTMGVATGKARRGVDHVFRHHDLGRFFVTAQTADGHPSKPHPSMLRAALAETGASQGVMVGDTEFDMAMAKAAGFGALGVAWGYHPVARLEAAGADVVIEDFDALDAALADLWGRE